MVGSEEGGWKRARKSNALAAYPTKPAEALSPGVRGQAARQSTVKAELLESQSRRTIPVLREGVIAHI